MIEPAALQFLQTVLQTPRPSGYEQRVQQHVREYARAFADTVQTDVHGNVICATNPDADRRLMMAGHCDQIGLLVSHVDDRGFLYTQTIGGWDPQQLVGQRMTVWTSNGPLPAVIARKPIHLLKQEEKDKVVKLEELWLDIGACSRDEAVGLVRIGDPVTLELGLQMMPNGLANSPGMDNACGVWVVMVAVWWWRAQ